MLEVNRGKISSFYGFATVYTDLCRGIEILIENEFIPKNRSDERTYFLFPIQLALRKLVKISQESKRKAGTLDLLEILIENTSDPAIRLCGDCGINKVTIGKAKKLFLES